MKCYASLGPRPIFFLNIRKGKNYGLISIAFGNSAHVRPLKEKNTKREIPEMNFNNGCGIGLGLGHAHCFCFTSGISLLVFFSFSGLTCACLSRMWGIPVLLCFYCVKQLSSLLCCVG